MVYRSFLRNGKVLKGERRGVESYPWAVGRHARVPEVKNSDARSY